MQRKVLLVCAAAAFFVPTLAFAALTQSQVSAIISVLQAFGVGSSVIANVEAALAGQQATTTPSATTNNVPPATESNNSSSTSASTGGSQCLDLPQNLHMGDNDARTNGEVSRLQQFLGVTPATGYFGPLTEQAVQRYQASHGVVSSGTWWTTGFGAVGPQTRASLVCNANGQNNQNETQNTQTNPLQNSTATTVTLTASPSTVALGQSTTLTWSSTNATTCTGSGFTANGTSGSVTVSPTFSITYGITCAGANGAVAKTASVTVTPGNQNYQNNPNPQNTPAVTLSASPAPITSGQSATLTWNSTNATSCTGVGFTANGTSGSVGVSPIANTNYVITCTGSGGSASANATIAVTPANTPPTSGDLAVVAGQTVNVRNLLPAYNPALDAVPPPTGVFGTGKIWHVGPSEQYQSLGAIASQLGNGDIVEIDAGTYACGQNQSIVWKASNITIVGVGGRPVFDATNCVLTGDKGIFDPQGTNMIIDNIEFMGAKGGSGNEAGIRLEGGGYVYLTNDYFHNNMDGLLANPYPPFIDRTLAPTNNMVIDHSEFAYNGDGSGQSHNMYIGDNTHTPGAPSSFYSSFVLRFSYSHNANVGHEVKSRAQSNYILYNRIADEADGNASFQIDLPQGGLDYIIGNVVQKGPNADNQGNMIDFAAEGASIPSIANPVQKLYVVNNTFDDEATYSGRTILWLNDAPALQDVWFKNNAIINVPQSQVFHASAADVAKVVQAGNVFLAKNQVYDAANRIYNLVAGSPAIDAGVNPGTANGFNLTPLYEFQLPHDGVPRPAGSSLDAGAYQYVPGQTVTPAPTITFTAAANPVRYDTPATITWTTTNATYCTASGAWSGSKAASGSFVTQALVTPTTFNLSCTGPNGTVSATPLTVAVSDSAQANALGTYTWQELPNTALKSVCPNASLYPGINGAFGCVGDLVMATGVYVPDTNMVYYMGGGGSYQYAGNEVYAFNLNTMQPVRVTDPTIPSDTTEYNGSTNSWPYTLAACSRALNLKSGGVAFANSGVLGQAAWDPVIKKIVIGPGGYQRQTGCTNISNFMTDVWTFDPVAKTWAQVLPPFLGFQALGYSSWFVDPVSGLAYTGTIGASVKPIGAYLIDPASSPAATALVDNTAPFAAVGTIAIDTTHHYALQLIPTGTGKTPAVGVYDLNGLSMTKYGTNGSTGTTGLAGGSGPEFMADTSWTVTGDTSLLSYTDPSITYNPKLDMFVAWTGTDKVYFIQLNYATKTANIIGKTITGGPTVTSNYGMAGYLLYIPSLDEYVAFTGMNGNFWLLKPPATTALGAAGTQLASAASVLPSITQTLLQTSTGAQVNVLQEMLKRLGLFAGETTSYFGPKTKAAVELFQLHHGIDPVGIVGPLTRKALNALGL